MNVRTLVATAVFLPLAGFAVSPGLAADQQAPSVAANNAKICSNCHKPDAGNLRGNWESVAMKTSSIQLKIDDRSEIVRFDKATVQVLNVPQNGDVEKMLRSIKKGHEVRIQFMEKNGVKYAKVVSSKPPIKLSEQEKIGLADMEKLVALGPEKGGYALFDSRPAPRFREGAIPTAVSLPFPEFDKNLDKLPPDKNKLVIFYCSGITCNMSPGSQKKAKALGYTNIKVFTEGMPAWLTRNYAVLSATSLKEAYKDIPYVLLDTRKPQQAEAGFIKGAVAFGQVTPKTLKMLPGKKAKAPIIVYDQDGKGNAAAVARGIVRAGYVNVMVLSGGMAAWKQAQYPVETGKLVRTVSYVPKAKPGEMGVKEFQKLIAAIPQDTLVVDVRNRDELADGVINGSVNIPADEIDQHIAAFQGKKVVTYCNTGTRAEMAYHALKAKGFTNSSFVAANIKFIDGKPAISK